MVVRSLFSRFFILGSLACIISAQASERNVPQYKVTGSTQFYIPIAPPSNLSQTDGLKNYPTATERSGFKLISLMNLEPSEQLKQKRAKQLEAASKEKDYIKNGITPFSSSKGAVDLGMNNVPVLDQGAYGTCVTFSSTAALDALLGKGDYIDQQCSLELDEIDSKDDTYPEGGLNGDYWNGAYIASQVINPILQQGSIKKGDCFGDTYPNQYASLTSLDQYTDKSDKDSFKSVKEVFNQNLTLDAVKNALNQGHRVVFGSTIGSLVQGFSVKVGKTKSSGGLWACKQSTTTTDYCTTQAGGHEIVIIGYDDAQELLKIRNSWGPETGDNGDYYMTYSYFDRMNIDGTEVF